MGAAESAHLRTRGKRAHVSMYVRNTTAAMHLTALKFPLFLTTRLFNVQHADVVGASELENLDQICTSVQSRRLNECADLTMLS